MPIASAQARGRNGWVEIVRTAPKLENPETAPPGGITRPPPNPVTGKPNRPGALLERRARQYAQTHNKPKHHSLAEKSLVIEKR